MKSADIKEMCRDGKCDYERVMRELELAVAREKLLKGKLAVADTTPPKPYIDKIPYMIYHIW